MASKFKCSPYQKVDEAIKSLIRANESINFNSVSNESGISKATLYNNFDIRERIEALGINNHKHLHQKKQVKREMNDSNKDALIESLKRKIKKLEGDNKQLRNRLKVAYAEVYKNFKLMSRTRYSTSLLVQ
ncbi:DUF6262 family protein [Peribacillus frigoritolerans]|uniref:DUF6262 family protein n=1 Tax=Peribacillus TaxID=2675229 RepID=UPI002E240A58|nr:DUF6262 family protein [Peribacillus frigoritolerans]